MNSIFLIAPYKYEGIWVFDDASVGLLREAFVSGADEIMDILSADIPDAGHGFTLLFSPNAFPGYTARFQRGRAEYGGTWYTWPERSVEGWLCPALFKYFETAPEEIYVKASAK